MNTDDTIIITKEILAKAKELGVGIKAENLPKIARAKNMMFGLAEWERCPCASNLPEKFCGSEACQKEIQEKGICCCNLYLAIEE